MKLKKRSLIFLCGIGIVVIFVVISNQIRPLVMAQAKIEMHEVIKKSIMTTTQSLKLSDTLIQYQQGRVHIDTNELNRWMSRINQQLEDEISNVEASVQWGTFTGLLLFQHVGPSIPAHFQMKKNILSTYQVESVPLGINNTLLKVNLEIEVSGYVRLGFQSEVFTMKESIPILFEYIQGEIPQYFMQKKDS